LKGLVLSYLDPFNDEQRHLLIALPYRAGLLVSESDEDGGDDAAAAEMQMLETLMVGYTEDFLKSEFVEEIMKQTLAHKEKWEQWNDNLDTVANECSLALEAMNAHMDSKDSLSYCQAIMEIAMAVAMAYREFEEHELTLKEKITLYGTFHWRCFMAKIKREQPPNLDEVLNISHSERTVLGQLAEALRIDMDGNPLGQAEAA